VAPAEAVNVQHWDTITALARAARALI